MNNNFVSIIFVTNSPNLDRGNLSRKSFDSLVKSIDYLAEIIIVDNGGSIYDSKYFLEQTDAGRATTYLRNYDNLWFAHARNQGIALSQGKYIAITDNDMIFKKGWLSQCVKILDATERTKTMVTPVKVLVTHNKEKYYREDIVIDGTRFRTNAMAGSNCWVMHRTDLMVIGTFYNSVVSGTRWCQHYSKLGYKVAILNDEMVIHKGERNTPYEGYKKFDVPMEKTLINGEKISLDKCL